MDFLAGTGAFYSEFKTFESTRTCMGGTSDVPQASAGRGRHAADVQGILHPRAVELDPLLAHKAVRVCVNGFETTDP